MLASGKEFVAGGPCLRNLERKRSHPVDGPTAVAGEIFYHGETLRAGASLKLKTKVFELGNGRYRNLSELAQAIGMSASHIYRVRQGKCCISEKFIIGAMKAFPEYGHADLFNLASEEERVSTGAQQAGRLVFEDAGRKSSKDIH